MLIKNSYNLSLCAKNLIINKAFKSIEVLMDFLDCLFRNEVI